MALGDVASIISKVNPSNIFSGSGPDGPGRLGSPQYAIDVLSNQNGIGPRLEAAFLAAKSKYLPKWLRMSFPIDNKKQPLGKAIHLHHDAHPTPKSQANSKLGREGNAGFMSKDSGTNNPNSKLGREGNAFSIGEGGWGGSGAIESIQSHAKSFTRPTKYRVILSAPDKMPNQDFSIDTSFSCSAAVLPGLSLSTFDFRAGEPNLTKRPYDVIYEDVKLTFQISEKMKEHDFFEQWINFIYDNNTKTFRYPKDYYADISIIQLDNSLSELKWINLIDAYPTSISEVALSYDSTNTISTFEVGFAYRSWETL